MTDRSLEYHANERSVINNHEERQKCNIGSAQLMAKAGASQTGDLALQGMMEQIVVRNSGLSWLLPGEAAGTATAAITYIPMVSAPMFI